MLNNEVVLNFLLSVRQITDAETVSLLVNRSNEQHSDALLLHEGGKPLSELVTTEHAILTTNKLMVDSKTGKSSDFSPVIFWKSLDKGGYLLQINLTHFSSRLLTTKNQAEPIDRRDNGLNKEQFKSSDVLWIGLNFAVSPVPEFIKVLISQPDYLYSDVPKTSVDWFVRLVCQTALSRWNDGVAEFSICQIIQRSKQSITGSNRVSN